MIENSAITQHPLIGIEAKTKPGKRDNSKVHDLDDIYQNNFTRERGSTTESLN